MMSLLRIPKGVLEKVDCYRSRFFGNVMSTRRNIGSRDGVSLINLKMCVWVCVCVWGGVGYYRFGHSKYIFVE
jgi:hypothetical protein